MYAKHISSLESILKHDNIIDEISLCFVAKKISFIISVFNEKNNAYNNLSIEFSKISNIHFSQMEFINAVNSNYGLDIFSFNATNLENENYNFQLLMNCNFGEQDLEITFNFSPSEIKITALN